MTFNHNDLGRPNGNCFALPYSQGEGDIEIIFVPWDVTTSYNAGTANAPQAIIEASTQVDLFDPDVQNAWEIKISNSQLDLLELNGQNRPFAEKVIAHLESGGCAGDREIMDSLNRVNRVSAIVNEMVYDSAKSLLDKDKTAVVVGGDHSTPFGLIKAVSEKYPGFGILHIDAHADLRQAYEGFEYSHASIMYNVVSRLDGLGRLVQVALRDFCEDEYLYACENSKICMFGDSYLKENQFRGMTWHAQCEEIVSHLPENVYISFDIDGLSPYLCPNTGTPVAGGLDFSQAMYLIKRLAFSGRKIVGFDLNEVSPCESSEWDANTGARVLFKLCCYTHYSNNK